MNIYSLRHIASLTLAITTFSTAVVAEPLAVSPDVPIRAFAADGQYYVQIRCVVSDNLSDVAGKIGNDGMLGGGIFNKNYKLAHFISLSSSAIEFTVDQNGAATQSSAAKFGHTVIPFAYSDTGDGGVGKSARTKMGCGQDHYLASPGSAQLEGRVGYSWDTQRPATDSSLVEASFNLVSGLGVNLGALAFGGALSGGALANLTEAKGVATSIDTFLAKFRGGEVLEDALFLGPGITQIRTPLSTVNITITETASYLAHDLPRFSGEGFRTFLDLGWTALTSNSATDTTKFGAWVAPRADFPISTAGETKRVEMRAFCRAFERNLQDAGLSSATDRAYVISKAVARDGGDVIGNLRCLSDAGLHGQLTSGPNRGVLNRYLRDDSVTFTADEVRSFQAKRPSWDFDVAGPWEAGGETQLFEARATEIAGKALLPGGGGVSRGNNQAAYLLSQALVPGNVVVQDTSGLVLGVGETRELSHIEFAELFGAKDLTRWGCYSSSGPVTQANDQAFFEGASGAFAVMEGIADPADVGVIKYDPSRSVLVLAYMDQISGRQFSHFVIAGRPTQLFNDNIGSCSDANTYEAPEPDVIAWSDVESTLADVWDFAARGQDIPAQYSARVEQTISAELSIESPLADILVETNLTTTLPEAAALLGRAGYNTWLGVAPRNALPSTPPLLRPLVFGSAQRGLLISSQDGSRLVLLRISTAEDGKLSALRVYEPNEDQVQAIIEALFGG
ncbi:hypothetical protein [Pacificibacter marinus]|uniref:Uncharacterized protein n=1 Tax=Pacificibacter marinus TaxID=658057 RepID=A0A1Y5TKZ5_9RHOB|nr:hypothetical protein [Pacificibacter marinus]SEL38741.1 hypothetical protein SAMN04488032_1232 [Pacificibacter marinus]SLN66015.1 hypothetical protein PAM7971_03478 [Pacificibacter marinus]